MSGHRGAFTDERKPSPFGFTSYEPFIRVARVAAELVIEMRYHQSPAVSSAQFMQHVEQHHRIQSSRHRRDEDASPSKRTLPAEGIFDDLGQ
jgi:hypothetical protein